jgi:hypothetical protein
MPTFVQLSTVVINVDAIRLILPGVVKPKEGEKSGCTVYFINSTEPFAFYGADAERILAAVSRERGVVQDEVRP